MVDKAFVIVVLLEKKIHVQQCKVHNIQHPIKNYQANESRKISITLRKKKNPSIETDFGIADVMKLANKDVKRAFINMFHVLK